MSVIDLFASGLGAFLVLTIALIPSIMYRTKDDGFTVPLKLAVTIDWTGRGVDLDRYVEHAGETVWARESQKFWGSLMRDENTETSVNNHEVFFVADFVENARQGGFNLKGSEGEYEVTVAYYDWSRDGRKVPPGPYHVTGNLVLFPGDKLRERREKFSVSVSQTDTWGVGMEGISPATKKPKLCCRFRISKNGDGSYSMDVLKLASDAP